MSEIGRWRRLYANEWHAAEFQSLTNDERVVYFYAEAGPQTTSLGIFRLSTAVAVEDLGNLSAIEFDARLDAVCAAFGWRFDAAARVLWIPEWLARNRPQSPNVVVSWRKLLGNLPDCDLKFEAAAAVAAYLEALPKAFREAFGSLPKDFRNSKAKTLANQGAGEAGNQGSGRKGAGARHARAGNGSKSRTSEENVSDELIQIARKTVYETPNADLEYLIDSFKFHGGTANAKRQQIARALEIAQQERRAS